MLLALTYILSNCVCTYVFAYIMPFREPLLYKGNLSNFKHFKVGFAKNIAVVDASSRDSTGNYKIHRTFTSRLGSIRATVYMEVWKLLDRTKYFLGYRFSYV